MATAPISKIGITGGLNPSRLANKGNEPNVVQVVWNIKTSAGILDAAESKQGDIAQLVRATRS